MTKPKIKPVTRWMTATCVDGKWSLDWDTYCDRRSCDEWSGVRDRKKFQRIVKVSITPILPKPATPTKKARKAR